MPPTNKLISIIVPAFNEEHRLGPFLTDLKLFCQKTAFAYEIIIVDDGSTDGTAALVEKNKPGEGLVLIRCGVNEGKGAALKKGVLRSKGDVCVFMDADGSYSPSMIEKNLHFFDESYDVVAGSRFLSGQVLDENVLRKTLRSFFVLLVKWMLSLGLEDTQCGFKMISRRAATAIFPKVTLKGFGMDLEALYLAKKMGFRIIPTPALCEPKTGSKVKVVRDSLKILLNLFQIRFRHSSGR